MSNFDFKILKNIRNEANFDILYTIYCNLGQFAHFYD
jgi:hypothetical protein